MAHEVERIALQSPGIGTDRYLIVHRFGTVGARPKAYLQGGLHANEAPGMMVLHHLLPLLADADKVDEIGGEIVIVPTSNPIGMSQFILGYQSGRYDLGGGSNFNRQLPLVGKAAALAFSDLHTEASATNTKLARAHLKNLVSTSPGNSEAEFLKRTLLQLAIDADIVIDCHSAGEAMLHALVWHANWPAGSDLVAQLGAPLALVVSNTNSGTFEEACAEPWDALRSAHPNAFPDRPSFVAGLELRGDLDFDQSAVAADAANLLKFLQRRGVLCGDPGPLPKMVANVASMESIEVVRSTSPGVVVFCQELRTSLRPGDVIAHVIEPAEFLSAKDHTQLRTSAGGILFSRTPSRIVGPGHPVAMIAGGPNAASGRHPWID